MTFGSLENMDSKKEDRASQQFSTQRYEIGF